MAYKLIVKTLAEKDIVEAIAWYAEQAEHLPKAFIKELDKGIEDLKANPKHYQRRYKQIRISFLQRFPYGIYYTIENDTVFVHAVLHSKRNPETGIQRV
ncbi:type II toxin-antitoxin system RelE/ParE family toxin [Sinomicrobium kalidii]|uniref:type II toxin-antitoxin system RelE/ParE family toxin n=1 Tax=Sinomicrobium kalidii TaxID=2900738 RepID=UPI001E3E1460|nr:type II toxin-antitoxin system RelE/ParE family toxin [Sinomicrobium kalidii]UGU14721.1 type II toxin-antitoxin system RelE/ParE family toxin [Sinomicrobium kalidii]